MNARLASVLVVCALAATGCNRKPTLLPAAADSSLVAPDSFTVHAREAVDAWDAGDDAVASTASAKLAREALEARPNAPWVERLRGVLDSLGIGAEVAGGDQVAVTNLFSRGRGDADSWPWLYWREDGRVRTQALEARGMRLVDVQARGLGEGAEPADSSQVAVLWHRRVGAGEQPQLTVWHRADGGRWDLLQTLGADSLGGVGSGEFSGTDSSAELTTRTFRPTPHFDECATCPHVFHERHFAWGSGGFSRVSDLAVPSPYSTFAAFIAALVANDRARASDEVVDPSLIEFARRFDWHVSAKGRWRVAPATDESALEMVFFRGAKDAFRVTFEPRDGDWSIAGFEPTSRAVE